MKIFLREITDTPQAFHFTQEQAWVSEAVQRVDEYEPDWRPERIATFNRSRPIEFDLTLQQVDEVVFVKGGASTRVQLLCSRCAMPFSFPCDPKINILFSQNADLAEGDDPDISHLHEDFLDLGDILAEQLQLCVPFQPLCRPDCKGVCHSCGADLNKGKCACKKIMTASPFSVLRDLVKRRI